jgi:hypothetical protein
MWALLQPYERDGENSNRTQANQKFFSISIEHRPGSACARLGGLIITELVGNTQTKCHQNGSRMGAIVETSPGIRQS